MILNKNLSLLSLLQFENLSLHKNIRHFITTREGGVSKSPFDSLNLSYHVQDNPAHVTNNRKILAQPLNIKPKQLIIPEQTHSTNVAVVTPKNMHDHYLKYGCFNYFQCELLHNSTFGRCTYFSI